MSEIKGKITINNAPANADHWIVARIDESDLSLWYFGSWPFNAYEVAVRAAKEVNGIVLENDTKAYLTDAEIEHYAKLAAHYNE